MEGLQDLSMRGSRKLLLWGRGGKHEGTGYQRPVSACDTCPGFLALHLWVLCLERHCLLRFRVKLFSGFRVSGRSVFKLFGQDFPSLKTQGVAMRASKQDYKGRGKCCVCVCIVLLI